MNENKLLIYLKMALQIHQETKIILLKNMKLKRKEIHNINVLQRTTTRRVEVEGAALRIMNDTTEIQAKHQNTIGRMNI